MVNFVDHVITFHC